VLPDRGEEHLLLPVEGFPRGGSPLRRLRALRPLARAVVRVLSFFRGLRPEVVVVTGGYAGGPAGIGAVLLRIPLLLQEQNSVPGLVTRALSLFARRVELAFPEARSRLPLGARRKARVTGNPVRPPREIDRREAREALGLPGEGRVVLVVGGSQGSAALNGLLLDAVSGVRAGRLERPPGLRVLWSTGPAHVETVRDGLDGVPPNWVRIVGYIDDMPSALAAADLAVSRAGAIATSEFLAWGLPAVLVPLPTAAADHQARNAGTLARAGAALHLPQRDLAAERLWDAVTGLVTDPVRLAAMARAAADRGRPRAAEEIVREIEGWLPPATAGGGEGAVP
ncbi:MAG TPA: UDP-N-acetylglucosamine--N-acetylmuramyl-(pentapeptide) pyrophosphoryl-undecaprenol N-acetylglucosamine transferase, partial [Longimicrobiales bacterium]|nr:UDP-N-acetylglucosamine--N-acetylmuramyl-(pentapeptide) pyrophosphoryl-undecaprenol N-acetylglucosamine transferase [Longimicrobiales bacterium]